MLRKLGLILLVGVLALSFAACTATEEAPGASETNQGEVVALVNNQEIYKSDFDRVLEGMKSQYLQFGIDFDSEDAKEILVELEKEAINNLVRHEVLLQDAKEKGYEAPQDELDYEIERIKGQFESEEEFENALEINNITLEQLKRNIGNEMILGEYLQQELGEESVTEEELRELYEVYSEMMEDIPEFEEIRYQLIEEIQYERFQEKFEVYVGKLMEENTIEILL
ncbi:SurA N-terminal domain-containing protein [Natronincola peptidivorans]|uniref:peptidylprolyl isomerase n=1 Tax=Natronincola peptidivorans TaxID=426128 RepID=A0A1H9ZWC3_9FIRM|nr:SurA N-terminal domain-containing protein [Natronincola peptidivorans]SES86106.1 SurA N-terminal domain-containing protein [Natronincola peptidivorans]